MKLDDVHVVESADVRIVREKDSYVVEASIPLVELPWEPQAGQKLRGDVGVIFSDAAGTINAQRVYWSNRETGVTADTPTEARLHPDKWGEVEVK